MARTFEIQRSGTTTIGLDSAADAGWRFKNNGWMPKVAQATAGRLPPRLVELIPCIVDRENDNSLQYEISRMDDMAMFAAEYVADRTQPTPVWLHAKMAGETGERRALVTGIERAITSPVLDETGVPAAHQMNVQLKLTREPGWERTAALTSVSEASISRFGGAFDYTASPSADVVGDMPARLYEMTLTPSAGCLRYGAYIGFRSANKHGTLANFVPLWEAEDAGVTDADTSATTDATASPGGAGDTKTVTTFAAEDGWENRIIWKMSDVTANYSDNYGRFLVLMRAKVGASTTVEAKLRHANHLSSTLSHVEKQSIEITETAWTWFEMGLVTVPLRDLRMSADFAHGYDADERLILRARRTSGSNSLEVDCLVLIPVDEYFIKLAGGENSANRAFLIGVTPTNEIDMLQYDTSNSVWTDDPVATHEGAGIPIGDGRAYLVAWEATLATTVTMTMQHVPRWSTLRGGE